MTPMKVAQQPNSTTGRIIQAATEPLAHRAARLSLRLVDELSPALAARAGERLMFKTRRRPLRPAEAELLASARRFAVASAHGPLTAWRWGSGPPVVVVHGWNGRAAQHGASPGDVSSLVHFADAVDAVLDAVRPVLGPAHAVIAHSMGGPGTAYALSRFRRQPAIALERGLRDLELPVERLVFVAPPIDVRDFIRSFSKQFGLSDGFEEALRLRTEQRFGVLLEDLYTPRVARRLSAPLLIVHDADDREVPVSRARLLARAWSGAELVVTRGLGHYRILSDTAVVEQVTRFVDAPRLPIAA
jgi:pimeloyl-ACP methyl ester carboxylesterase